MLTSIIITCLIRWTFGYHSHTTDCHNQRTIEKILYSWSLCPLIYPLILPNLKFILPYDTPPWFNPTLVFTSLLILPHLTVYPNLEFIPSSVLPHFMIHHLEIYSTIDFAQFLVLPHPCSKMDPLSMLLNNMIFQQKMSCELQV